MLDTQAISDHIEIQQLMVRYANALDFHEFERLDSVFTPDAYLDYTAFGGIAGHYPEIKTWLPDALGRFVSYQHLVGNIEVDIQGDRATARTACYNPMVIKLPPKGNSPFFLGFWYEDELVHTADGWRISQRIEKRSYAFNRPLLMRIAQWFLARKK